MGGRELGEKRVYSMRDLPGWIRFVFGYSLNTAFTEHLTMLDT